MQYFLVGGAVRDLLLGRTPREYDLSLDAEALSLIQANALTRKVGMGHEVWLLNGVEHSLLRGGDIDSDLLARDFTINALALPVPILEAEAVSDGRIYFHPQALEDLKNKVIRPCATHSLADDPVRVLRAARFCAELPDFSLAPETLDQMAETRASGALANIATEQAGKETMKALNAQRPGNFLRALCKGRVLTPWFAELEGADKVPGGPPQYHNSSVLEHIARVMDACAESLAARPTILNARPDPIECETQHCSERNPENSTESKGDGQSRMVRDFRALAVWMALCHDLGKNTTPKEQWPRHILHELRGVSLAKNLGKRLSLPNKFIRAGQVASKLHMKAGIYRQLKSGTKVDLLTEVHYYKLLEPFGCMVNADSGEELSELMRADLRKMLAVRLPAKDRNQGEKSGEMLRLLRCKALSATS